MLSFLEWNNRIAAHFFRPEMAGRRVHLFVTRELIEELGQRDGVGTDDFVRAVKKGPLWRQAYASESLAVKAHRTMLDWRVRALHYPPYIAYLGLFVLAAGVEGDFRSYAYYPRLRALLGEGPDTGQYPHFDRMLELWDDLETWSTIDTNGELGIFYTHIAGNWIHVGLPQAQTMLSERERYALPAIFGKAGLDPTSPPQDRHLANLILQFGRDELRLRTRSLLESIDGNQTELREALIEAMLDELHNWDGSHALSSTDHDIDAQASIQLGILRLCCELDRVAGHVRIGLRCKSRHGLPHETLVLVSSPGDRFQCDDYAAGWSTLLRTDAGPAVDAAELSWTSRWSLEDLAGNWRFQMASALVRVFASGAPDALPGLIEVNRLPVTSPFYLAVHDSYVQLVSNWGRESCQGFVHLPVSGLPPGWQLFTAQSVTDDRLVRDRIPILALPWTVRLRLEGGIRSARGNRFFTFAPPQIMLEAPHGSVRLYCNDTLLDPISTGDRYRLPKHTIQAGSRITIEARENGNPVKRLSLYFDETFLWPPQEEYTYFDKFSNPITEPAAHCSRVAGAWVIDARPPPFDYSTTIPGFFSDTMKSGTQHFLVGQEPGQVSTWPLEGLPDHWIPIWALSIRGRRGMAAFCGPALVNPDRNGPKPADRRKVRLWRELLWHRRKRISAPALSDLRSLWREYQEAARDVDTR